MLVKNAATNPPYDLARIGDLKDTYAWLNQHRDQTHRQLHAPLFLNVDDPSTDDWEWKSAPDLVFNAPDDRRGTKRYVRTFLLDIKPLLIVAGAHEIKQVSAPTINLAKPEEALDSMRESFNEMRHNNLLTDVIIQTRGEGELLAHRVVLAAQSEYFKTSFTRSGHDEAEGGNAVVHMSGFLPKSVETMLGEHLRIFPFPRLTRPTFRLHVHW